jgi:hypothetical protein
MSRGTCGGALAIVHFLVNNNRARARDYTPARDRHGNWGVELFTFTAVTPVPLVLGRVGDSHSSTIPLEFSSVKIVVMMSGILNEGPV